MNHFEINQPVGNYKTNKVGTIASASLKGAQGEFKGFLILLKDNSYEVWDESSLVVLPMDYDQLAPGPSV
jgi:hypothetical protein